MSEPLIPYITIPEIHLGISLESSGHRGQSVQDPHDLAFKIKGKKFTYHSTVNEKK